MPLRPEVWVVSGDFSQLVVPLGCASCGAATSRARLLVGPGKRELFVPYCGGCLDRIARADTAAFSVVLASGLLSAGLAVAFPMLWPHAPLWLHAAATLAFAFSPYVLIYVLSKGRPWPSSAWPSVRLWRERELVCDRRDFAEELAARSGLGVSSRRELRLARGAAPWLAPLLGVALAVTSHVWQHPALRVLNLTGTSLWLSVDGGEPIAIEPSTIESPFAGLSLRVPRGTRTLLVKSASGELVAQVTAALDPGHEHLFAPGSAGECFWIESTGYGKEHHHEVHPLVSASRFWRLDVAVDTWFVPSPAAHTDGRSTGGTLTALRHAPCERAPIVPGMPARRAEPPDDESTAPAVGP
jgi:hypothetical protein